MTTSREVFDPLVFGRRLRHFRKRNGMTLADVSARVDRPVSYLSMLETGKREPKLSLVPELADAVGVTAADLLTPEPPSRRAGLEVALERAQADPLAAELGLPYVKATAKLPDEVLEHLVRLHGELALRAGGSVDPQQGRTANLELRDEMRRHDNYFEHIEKLASAALDAVDYQGSGPVSQGTLADLTAHFGFTVQQAQDLPPSAKSVVDLRHRVIYVPQRDAIGTRGVRSVLLRTLGHFVLDHEVPVDLAEHLAQRVEADYFAGAVLAPERAAVEFLRRAKRERDLSVADLKEVFYVSYEMAAHRFTNLATRHLGIPTHFTRSDEDGIIWLAYENDGVPYPVGPDGSAEGQRLCREWATRQAFHADDVFAIHYQYTETPRGTYFCATHVEVGREPRHAVTVGVPEENAHDFRGRGTDRRSVSRCPDPSCCRLPASDLAQRWDGMVWASVRAPSDMVTAISGSLHPGVDLTDVYEFLGRRDESG